MKILQVNKLYYPYIGGVETVVQQIAEGLNDRTDMQVLCCTQKGKGSEETINGVDVVRASSLGTFWSMPISFSFLRKMRSLSKDADAILSHMPFPLADLGYLLSGFKGPLYIWWHAGLVRQKKVEWLYKPLMNAFLKRAKKIFVATEYHITSSPILSQYKDKCQIIPFGIDAEEYDVPKGQSQLAKSKKIKILFVGRLVYYKGIDVLLRAFDGVGGAELYIIGNGALENEIKTYAKNSAQADNIHFLGSVSYDELKSCFMDCDFLVLPSVANSEGFGLVQLEAMVCSKPVINTWLDTGVPKVSLDGQTGLTVEPGNVEQLSQAMQKLIDSEALRKQFGKNGRERALSEFSLSGMMDSLYDAMKE